MATYNMERVTPPASPLVTLAEAKEHLRVSHLAEDALIQSYLDAIEAHLDGYEGVLGRALWTQSWRLTLEHWPCGGIIRLPLVPFGAVTGIAYVDAGGDPQTLDPALYIVRRDLGFGVVMVARNATLPAFLSDIAVTYTCGEDLAANEKMRARIGAIVKLMLGDLYDNRSGQVEGRIVNVNPTVQNLITPLVVRSWQ